MSSEINFDHIQVEEKPFANRLAAWIKNILKPESVLDIGCGPGHFVDSMRDVGLEAYGIDVDNRIIGHKYCKHKSIFDIEDENAEVVISLEVAEHIATEYSELVVRKIASTVNKTLIFTAAQPGQGGVGHINCQFPAYWSNLFEREGLERNTFMEGQLRHYCQQGAYMGWFYNNILVFNKVLKKD